jgi:hypothetical protein
MKPAIFTIAPLQAHGGVEGHWAKLVLGCRRPISGLQLNLAPQVIHTSGNRLDHDALRRQIGCASHFQ